ncbi:MAG: helix-turn-helix domain-containing protein [Hyphomicrobiaceae bacterium]
MDAAILETAKGLHRVGIVSDDDAVKITMRLVDKDKLPTVAPPTADGIRAIRDRAGVSQAVFARYLNLTVGHVSQLDRGEKRPRGAAAKLLDAIRRKGLDAIARLPCAAD